MLNKVFFIAHKVLLKRMLIIADSNIFIAQINTSLFLLNRIINKLCSMICISSINRRNTFYILLNKYISNTHFLHINLKVLGTSR